MGVAKIVKSWVDPKDKEVKRLVPTILEWMILSSVKGIYEDTSAAETDMTVVTLPSKRLKSCQKLQPEDTIGKWPEAQWMAAPQINAGLAVAAAA